MPDIATPVATLSSGVLYGSAIALGVSPSIALLVALAAALGASIALSSRGKIEFSISAVLSSLLIFLFAWAIGALGGTVAGAITEALIPGLKGTLPTGAMAPFFALFLAAYGQSHLVPLVKRSLNGYKSNIPVDKESSDSEYKEVSK
jgi:hypothetical protein